MQNLMKNEILSFRRLNDGKIECVRKNVASGLVRNDCVKVSRLFPFTDPDHFWVLTSLDDNESEIGMIEDPADLDEDSVQWLKYDLEEREFEFQVIEVFEIAEEFQLRRISVQTQEGRRTFFMRMDHWPTEKKRGVLNFKDLSNDVYEVDLEKMNSKSMKLLAAFIDK